MNLQLGDDAAWSAHCGSRLADGQKGVWTMSTLMASDRVVRVPDWAGFGMFSGVPSGCKGWNAVRIPPWHRFPQVRGPLGL
jgi:hypothetical protein